MRQPSFLLLGLLILSFSYSACLAQHDSGSAERRAYFSADAGIGFSPKAILQPAATNTWNNYLLPGYSFSGSGGIPILHLQKITLGITAHFGYYSNWFNVNKYLNYLASTDPNHSSYEKWQTGAFTAYSGLAGVYGTCTIGKTTFELKITGGSGYVILPNCSYYVIYAPPVHYTVLTTQTYQSKAGLACNTGFQINYSLGKNISATFDCEYLMYSCSYTNVMYEGSNLTGIQNKNGVAGMQILNALLGLTYTFVK